ncbi:lipopolysaccharide assembly protein LapB, partial [Endozoicomonas sp. ONNA2]|uniref:tetratricopeptide repeat protein n=1 Tax=Endozoicomonas sp. ONNA2 TaxID=2828741 RepID=UPI002147ED8F
MNSDDVHFNYAHSSARYREKKYCRTDSGNRPCFNRSVSHIPPSQGTSKTAPGYLSRSSNTSDNRLPKVVEDFQISLSSTDQSDAAATGAAATGAAATGAAAIDGGHWLNSREMSLFDQSESEWVLQKPRKKKSDTVNANSASHSVAGDHRWDNIQRIDQGFTALSAGNNEQALKIADELEELLKVHGNLSLRNCRRVYQLKARALFKLGRFDDCLQAIGQLKRPLDKGMLFTRGRVLQATHRFCEALPIFKELYINHSKSNKNKKVNGLALGRLYEDMGLGQEALTIFRKLRTDLSGHEDIPCNNRVIELTLGRLYNKMGRHREALTIFKKLRTDCSGYEYTPCNDKDIELALGRLYQDMGLHQEALTIFIKLRTDRSGHENTPCNDKEIELALGRQYQYMARHEEALMTFGKLHANRCGHEDTPCSDKDIALTLGR